MVKNIIKLYRRFFLQKPNEKTNKKDKEDQGWNVLCIRGYDFTYAEFKTL